MTSEQPVIGVLGGMGPAATAHFQTRLVTLTRAVGDSDHPTVVTWSDPSVPDRVAALRGAGPSPVPVLRTGLSVLAAAGAQVLAVPCNTVHPFLPAALDGFSLQLVDMIEVSGDQVATAGMRTVAVLATSATLEHGMYHRALARRSRAAQTPEGDLQAVVLEMISSVKAGAPTRDLVSVYEHLVTQLAEAGCDGVLVACSELSAVAAASADTRGTPSVPTVDAVDALARATLVAAGRIARD